MTGPFHVSSTGNGSHGARLCAASNAGQFQPLTLSACLYHGYIHVFIAVMTYRPPSTAKLLNTPLPPRPMPWPAASSRSCSHDAAPHPRQYHPARPGLRVSCGCPCPVRLPPPVLRCSAVNTIVRRFFCCVTNHFARHFIPSRAPLI